MSLILNETPIYRKIGSPYRLNNKTNKTSKTNKTKQTKQTKFEEKADLILFEAPTYRKIGSPNRLNNKRKKTNKTEQTKQTKFEEKADWILFEQKIMMIIKAQIEEKSRLDTVINQQRMIIKAQFEEKSRLDQTNSLLGINEALTKKDNHLFSEKKIEEALSYSDLHDAPMFTARTSFISSTLTNELWQLLKKELFDLKIDFEDTKNMKNGSSKIGSFQQNNGRKIQALFHSLPETMQNGSCHFNVQFFKQSDTDKILVEFQLRSGCREAFRDVRCQLLNRLQKHVLNKKIPKSRIESLKFKFILDESTFLIAVDMASSPYLEVYRDGFHDLASYSYDGENQNIFLEHINELLPLIQKSLEIEADFITQRYVSIIVANLSQQRGYKLHLCKLSDMLNNILSREEQIIPHKLYLIDTKRQLALARNNLLQT